MEQSRGEPLARFLRRWVIGLHSLEEVSLFFETEIFASLLEQIFHESRLAKLASRMVLLDHAIINIESELKRTSLSKQRVHHRTLNRHLLDSLSGVSLWSQ